MKGCTPRVNRLLDHTPTRKLNVGIYGKTRNIKRIPINKSNYPDEDVKKWWLLKSCQLFKVKDKLIRYNFL
jgi:hypothetical protein